MTKGARRVYTATGLLLVGIGFVGIFMPGLPTTVWLIMALFCFKRGSERLENWLLDHPRFGPTLRDWDANRSIKKRTKLVAISTMWAFCGVSLFLVRQTWVQALILALAAFATWYIASRKTADVATN